MMDEPTNLTDMVVDIVTAYIAKNSIPSNELPALIHNVHGALTGLGTKASVAVDDAKQPAVSIKKSVGQDYIICLEDGRKFKSLKRHLRTGYNMSPEEYRAKWNLPNDYPMVAPAYAAARSALAKQSGLGQLKRTPAKPAPRKRTKS
jgi:predicted transcriptional regulator